MAWTSAHAQWTLVRLSSDLPWEVRRVHNPGLMAHEGWLQQVVRLLSDEFDAMNGPSPDDASRALEKILWECPPLLHVQAVRNALISVFLQRDIPFFEHLLKNVKRKIRQHPERVREDEAFHGPAMRDLVRVTEWLKLHSGEPARRAFEALAAEKGPPGSVLHDAAVASIKHNYMQEKQKKRRTLSVEIRVDCPRHGTGLHGEDGPCEAAYEPGSESDRRLESRLRLFLT